MSVVRGILPDYWTVREYKPDYGIDLEIELFESKSNQGKIVYDTLGEHIFVQVKGTEQILHDEFKVYERYNVEKAPLKPAKLFKDVPVVKFQVETAELYTVERMSNAVPVLLFLVDIVKEEIYFLCLNDYVDKVLIPSDPDYHQQKTKTLYIPRRNLLTKSFETLYPIMFYAKRPKLYAFFNKVNYQRNEFNYYSEDTLIETYKHFTNILLRLDVWGINKLWKIMDINYGHLSNLKKKGLPGLFVKAKDDYISSEDDEWETNFSFGKTYTRKQTETFLEIRVLWDQLNSLSHIYEEHCREWFLPTYLSEASRE